MEDENITKTEKQPSSLMSALGLLGLGLSVIAIALAIMAMVKVGDTAKDMNEKIEKAASIALETKKISDRIDSLALQLEEVKSNDKTHLNTIVSKLNAELSKFNAVILENRKGIEENRNAIEIVAKRAVQKAQPKPEVKKPENTTSEEKTETTTTTNGATKKHVIQSGDTFGKLAKKYGVSVSAIISANPDANPSRLKVGQEIVIP
jgi:LysM repeat protein